MFKKISILLSFIITFVNLFAFGNISFAQTPQPNISAEYAVLMDYTSGKVLYEKNSNSKLSPASTTKMWTAYLTLKYVKNLDEVVTVGNIGKIDGTSMHLVPGEQVTVRQLLEGLLLVSGNDAAVVLAQHVSGSIPDFVDLMNDEAKKVGAINTHFNNPNGLPDSDHYTTAYDMALMAREAMNNDEFRNIVNKKTLKVPPTNISPERTFVNTNKFLTGTTNIPYNGTNTDIKYDIVDGIKTGFTDDAGKCLLSSAKKNDMRLISTVFKTDGEPNLYTDSRTLLDYGFNNFNSKKVIDKNDFEDSKFIWYAKGRKLDYSPKYSYYTVINTGDSAPKFETKTKLNTIKLPIKKGDTVGTLEIYQDKEKNPVANVPIVAQNDVVNIFSLLLNNSIVKNMQSVLIIGALLIITFVILVLIIKKVRNIKRKKLIYDKNKSIYSNKKNDIYTSNKRRRRRH
ncbi:D-alanyl-D-alanine carboxypeptidase family protein [Paraclostridium ghonii]|uniref:serine-type D-Ala-D-Ala carboxypeptidase n=1 Tax=Paraclostridium ghonii TaxID=29358 RepID=A0ABU0N0X5_9FIRM|nr:D-alanyl-D-alanine carboxypeptidase family protein [Paeniclostridium ghonii]MDQ0556812.1 D-alanyl-D-alanine carboxypeptidase (penicillin-binding protein 5/6) [Paeniclostridium ghonii]